MKCLLSLLILTLAVRHVISGSPGCHGFTTFRSLEYALYHHVIKTVHSIRPDQCLSLCKATPGCFSTNMLIVPVDGRGTCELNRSTRDQSPESYKRRPGYEYNEIMKKTCSPSDAVSCINKQALPGQWFRFSSSKFKYFPLSKSWLDAKAYCTSLGGNLASIASEQENTFVNEAVIGPGRLKCNYCNSTDQLMAYWRFDGTDSGVTLYENAQYRKEDGFKALYLNGQKAYASVPAVEFHQSSFTVTLWIKTLNPLPSRQFFFADWSSPFDFAFIIHHNGQIQVLLHQIVDCRSSSSTMHPDSWDHLAITWSRPDKKLTIYVNGILSISCTSSVADVDLLSNNHAVYDIGLKRDTNSEVVHGYLREFHIYHRALNDDQVKAFFDSGGSCQDNNNVWIGLNDLTTEGTLVWSDGKPLEYSRLTSDSNSALTDCVAMTNSYYGNWLGNICHLRIPFVCETP